MELPKVINKKVQLLVGIIIALLLLLLGIQPLKAQLVGGPCQGCEAVLEFGKQALNSIDTLPEFEMHKNQLLVTGTVYRSEGVTPAPNVIVYAYHTNEKGIYPTRGDEEGWGRRHGYIRGWVKTDANGSYAFYTFKPASYPSLTEPAHVHLTVKEPDIQEYWIDSVEFEGDPLLTEKNQSKKRQRGGSGMVTLKRENGLLMAKRDIFLGKNIPNHPR